VPTNDIFEYELKGFGEEPLASGHKIIECTARKIEEHTIEVANNTSQDHNYMV